ncbi:hypothetical protein K8O68_07245 [Salipaludibacillus sp. CUR1]|uniref:hypothetical protein n=1 Tax=Salipaludibacillus sp. CUR1 TaxID=2820003 RepID=UPI001E4DFB9A|nr:hypothetical protein [Salipaludibacillus sp. CUR1]MCE7792220.1 hypothetical protein [Salipaludibacillus sp. CUR1]
MWVLLVISILLIGCSQEQEEIADFSGRVTGPPDKYDVLLVLKEDTLGGESVKNDVNRHLRSDYEANAYRVHLTPSTEISDADGSTMTAGEVEDLPYLFLSNRRVAIHTKEPWEEEWTELNRYLRYQPRFLPVYTADKIELSPYTLDDFITFNSPLNDSRLSIFTFYKNEEDLAFTSEANEELREHLGERERMTWESFYLHSGNPLEEELALDPVTHLVLSHEGKEIMSNDWREVADYLKHREDE